ncbi:ADP-glyceromanno-heptose 6-epimerase [Aquirufa sp.]|jgi:ADP-L-glycero-D-manno-heptose 6-epimerase|uniref:ADP-glyceromanno-heptose 6-epimerase n=1 Tax=Aquirufa sp. TaxID=2676249 RepID=UPI0037BF9C19
MIIVTGAAGFIGSCLIARLNELNFNYIIAVDDFSFQEKNKNLDGKQIKERVERTELAQWLDIHFKEVEFCFHIGARTDTTEFNKAIFDELNLDYSKMLWSKCIAYQIPFVYASSAATYGLGERGYDDDESLIPQLKPLNAYGDSKNDFDIWALQQPTKPFFWAGLKFFNVYGPNEYHKGRMASVIWHAFNQINERGSLRLFKSHRIDYADGEQMRDFIYVKDLIAVCIFLMEHRKNSGIYNLGTGIARSFNDLGKSTFHAMNKAVDISYVDTPVDIRDKYQYFTEANMQKLRSIGYENEFYTLENGVKDYVQNYLIPAKYW